MGASSTTLSQQGNCIVTVFSEVSVHTPEVSVFASARPRSLDGAGNRVGVLSNLAAFLPVASQSMMLWSEGPRRFYIPNMGLPSPEPTHYTNALNQMIENHAFEGSSQCLDVDSNNADLLAGLAELSVHGHAFLVQTEGGITMWQLRSASFPSVEVCKSLQRPRQFFQVREQVPITDMTRWELLQLLASHGWTWKPLPRTSRREDVAVVHPESAKVWYCTRNIKSVHRYYLIALLHVNKLSEANLLPLRHGEKASFIAPHL
jgi:hypothetical protein